MNNKQNQQISKRQALRAERARQAQRQRTITIGVIGLVVVVIIGLLAITPILNALTPVGEFTHITPATYQKADGLKMGDPNAKVRIDIFEDFKCHACQDYTLNVEAQVISQLVDTGKAYYVFHNFPFLDDQAPATMKESDLGASAAMCAAEQNHFWDFKMLMFSNMNAQVGDYTSKKLVAFAGSLGMDSGKFETCLNKNPYQTQIDADIALGTSYKITGTPSVFVNDTQVAPGYVPSYDQIAEAVNKALGQ